MEETDERNNAESTTPSSRATVPDGGYGWVVTIGCLTINIIYDGCNNSFGILFVNILDYFGDTKSSTALIGSLFFSIPFLCAPFARIMVERFGHRKATMVGGMIAAGGFAVGSMANSILMLYLCYGLISGFGMSIPYFTAAVTVAKYFKTRLALATGIVECGAGLGTVIFAPVTEYLISMYGWRGALLILSGVVGNIVVCGALIRPVLSTYPSTHTNSAKKGLKTSILEKLESTLRDSKQLICLPFLAFTTSNSIMYFWYDVPYIFTVDRALSLGIASKEATVLVSIIGIMHTIGCVLYGFIGDRGCINASLLYGVSLTLCGFSLLVVPLCFDYMSLAITAACFGLFSASIETLCAIIMIDIAGVQRLNHGISIVILLQGIANIAGPPIAGLLYDITDKYDATFYASGACVIAAGSVYTAYRLYTISTLRRQLT